MLCVVNKIMMKIYSEIGIPRIALFSLKGGISVPVVSLI